MKKPFLIFYFILFLSNYISGYAGNPDPPTLNFVSVDPSSGYTHFSWEPSDSVDVVAYIIHRWTGPHDKVVIDTVGKDTTNWVWEVSWGNYSSESYSISAINSLTDDGKESKLTDPHTTIFLQVNFDPCKGSMNLEWNPYGGWEDNLSHYTIFKKENDGDFSPINPDNDTTYIDEDVSPYFNYCYYIEASHQDGRKSTSNMACDSSNMPRPPDYLNANGTIFTSNIQVEITFTVDPNTELDEYYLIRGESISELTDTVEIKIQSGGGTLIFNDEIDDEIPYYYQLLSMNSCGLIIKRSNISSTIQLAAASTGFINILSWNSYVDWIGGVEKYEIYRSVDGGTMEPLSPGPEPNDTSYTDQVEDLILNSNVKEFCYYLIATEGDGNPYETGFSKSNQVCVQAESFVHMPNAFTPNGDGLNDEFKPVLTFTPKEYLFIIRSRWGNTMFQTEDPDTPWDGSYKGSIVNEDVYIYYLKVTDQNGQLIEKNGQVMVIHPAI